MVTRRAERASFRNAKTSRPSDASSATTRSATTSTRAPASVGVIRLPTRLKRRVPRSRSRSTSEWLTADCVRWSAAAARVTLPVRATSATRRRCRSSSCGNPGS